MITVLSISCSRNYTFCLLYNHMFISLRHRVLLGAITKISITSSLASHSWAVHFERPLNGNAICCWPELLNSLLVGTADNGLDDDWSNNANYNCILIIFLSLLSTVRCSMVHFFEGDPIAIRKPLIWCMFLSVLLKQVFVPLLLAMPTVCGQIENRWFKVIDSWP